MNTLIGSTKSKKLSIVAINKTTGKKEKVATFEKLGDALVSLSALTDANKSKSIEYSITTGLNIK